MMKELMATVVTHTGGIVSDGRFIEKPGIMVLNDGQKVTESALGLFRLLNISGEQSPEHQMAEFVARLTYWSFPKSMETKEEARAFHERLQSSGHLSPYRLSELLSVFIAGDLETVLEIICHKGRAGRTSSSRTISMNNPLFRIWGTSEQREMQKDYILKMLDIRRGVLNTLAKSWNLPLGDKDILYQQNDIVRGALGLSGGELGVFERERFYDATEQLNAMHPACKAGFVVNAMSADDWRWVIGTRLCEKGTVEGALVQVLDELLRQLSAAMPRVFC